MNQAIDLTLDEATLKQWIGRREQKQDTIAAKPANFLKATLNQHGRDYKTGDPLPPGWHWMYFLQAPAPGQLGRDGHIRLGGFLPPVALPKRMWAGTRLKFHNPVIIGDKLVKISVIKHVQRKSGRSGELCFVTINHRYFSGCELTLEENQDIVYRSKSPASPPGPLQPAPVAASISATIMPSTTLLFRYSALTFNGHRIHYDLDFCKDVEGYPGLVVHAPLTATLMLALAGKYFVGQLSRHCVKEFQFRAVRPLYHNQPFTLYLQDHAGHKNGNCEIWAAAPDGSLAMSATLVLAT